MQNLRMTSRVERYLAHLDQLTAGAEPRFQPIESTKPGLKGVTTLVYEDTPPGLLAGVTYGLSLADHADWQLGKPELCISVRSTDISWALAVGFLAEQLRGSCPFCYGDTINFGERVSPESEMTAFAVFAPAVLDREDYTGINVGDTKPINIAGCYPIHDAEKQYIQDNGLEAFWDLDWDPYDVTRPPAV